MSATVTYTQPIATPGEDIVLHAYPQRASLQCCELQDGMTPTSRTLSEIETPPQDEITNQVYPKGIALAILFGSACLSLLLTEMDNQILATAIPAITDTYKTIADVGWYSSVYRLSACSFQFMFGKLYRTFPLKNVFICSLVVFESGSAVCGSAPTSSAFIVGRAIAGVGASGVIAGCFQILTVSFPLRYRPAMAGLAGGVEGVSIVAAPLVGGLITDKINWRWCFYINLPLGAVTLILLTIFLKNPPARPPNADLPWKEKITQLDPLGTAVFVPAIACLFVALQYGTAKYGWADSRIIVLFALAGVLLGVFCVIQWKRQDRATLPPRIIRRRSVLAGFLFSLCTNSALTVVTYYLPTYFQVVKQNTPSKAGLLIMPMLGGFIISMMFAGTAISLVGFYVPFMLVASVLMPIASGLLTTLKVNGPTWKLMIYEVLFGLGTGIGFQAPQVAVQTTLSDADVSMGLNIIVFAQNFGPALFISVAQSVFSSRLVSNLNQYAPGIDSSALETMGLSDLKLLIPASELQEALLGYDKAITQTFFLSVALTCFTVVGSLAMEWRSVKEKRN